MDQQTDSGGSHTSDDAGRPTGERARRRSLLRPFDACLAVASLATIGLAATQSTVLALVSLGALALAALAVRRTAVRSAIEIDRAMARLEAGERELNLPYGQVTTEWNRPLARVGRIQHQLRELEDEVRQNRSELIEASGIGGVKPAADMGGDDTTKQELEQFVHIASHDLREPMSKAYSFCELLQVSAQESLDETQLLYLDRIKKSVSQATELINDLRRLTSMRNVAFAAKPCPFDSIFFACLKDSGADLTEASLEIDFDDLPPIAGHRSLLIQMVDNVVQNALKHGSKPLELRANGSWDGGPLATLTFSNRKDAIDVAKADNDLQTSPDPQRLLLPFVRGSTRTEGTGMGLAICKKVVQIHGGSIQVAPSAADHFSLIVTLPVVQDQAEQDWDGRAEFSPGPHRMPEATTL